MTPVEMVDKLWLEMFATDYLIPGSKEKVVKLVEEYTKKILMDSCYEIVEVEEYEIRG